ncbi:MAG TPA: hypothetical protein VFI27_21885 [candidate division Zixibacteria bacterium]|nr:hypothetical protein [candidate division Zixibacteria bacterium]
MKRWSIRLGMMLFIVVWLIAFSFPLFAIILANNDEIAIGPELGSHIRLFLVRSAKQKGIGLERVWRLSGHSDCFQGRVNYLLWEGSEPGQAVGFCVCYDPETGYRVDQSVCTDRLAP